MWEHYDLVEINPKAWSIRINLNAVAKTFYSIKDNLVTKFFEFGGYNMHIVFINNDYEAHNGYGQIKIQVFKKESLYCLAAQVHQVQFPTIDQVTHYPLRFEICNLDKLYENAKYEDLRLAQQSSNPLV